jgi:curved DNA-binding protein CbpA
MTFYEVLELDRHASTEEIERAFRRLARKVHPDLNSGDPRGAEARMKVLNEIRDTLTDPLRRAVYDAGIVAAPPSPISAVSEEVTETRPSGTSWSSRLLLALAVGTLAAGTFAVAIKDDPTKDDLTKDEPISAHVGPVRDASMSSDAASLLAVPTTAARPSFPGVAPPASRARPSRRAVVRIGSRADEVLRQMGTPDRVETGAHSGDAVFHYGHLRLEIKNGRVARGDAAE